MIRMEFPMASPIRTNEGEYRKVYAGHPPHRERWCGWCHCPFHRPHPSPCERDRREKASRGGICARLIATYVEGPSP